MTGGDAPTVTVFYVADADNPAGGCIASGVRPGNPEDQALYDQVGTMLGARYPACTGAVAPTGGPPPPPTPAQTAQAIWERQMELVEPTVDLAPFSRAVAGVETELDIQGEGVLTQTFPFLGGASIRLTARIDSYDIDWGDGQWSQVAAPAGATPDARHVYTDKGVVDVRVYATWSGTWTMTGGGSGTVEGVLETEGVREGYPVIELQAVRLR